MLVGLPHDKTITLNKVRPSATGHDIMTLIKTRLEKEDKDVGSSLAGDESLAFLGGRPFAGNRTLSDYNAASPAFLNVCPSLYGGRYSSRWRVVVDSAHGCS